MVFESYTATNVGRLRKNNEDNFYVNGVYKVDDEQLNDSAYNISTNKSNLYAVCDGMGGEEFGEKASLISVSALTEYQGKVFGNFINDYIEKANKQICDFIIENNGKRSGTTFAALNIENDTAKIFNIGDSRVYMYRNGKLTQLSVDHTRIQQMLNMGVITPDKAKNHKDKHVLTQHFGIFPDEMIISPHITQEISLKSDDVFLLCSDGLTDMLSDDDIKEIINKDKDVKKCCNSLIERALTNGGKDNVTVQIVRCIEKRKKSKLFLIILGIVLIIVGIAYGIKGSLPTLRSKDIENSEMVENIKTNEKTPNERSTNTQNNIKMGDKVNEYRLH